MENGAVSIAWGRVCEKKHQHQAGCPVPKNTKNNPFPQTSCKNVKANEISAIQQNVGHSWTTLTVPLFLSGWRGQGSKVLELSGKIMSGW